MDVGSLFLCDLGHETKAMMNNSGPRYKRSQLEKRLNTDVLWCVLLLLVMCLTAAVGEYPHRSTIEEKQRHETQSTKSQWVLQRLMPSSHRKC